MELSIIIVNYRSKGYLEKCLVSIHKKMFLRINGEIILVNNDSDENIDEYGKRYGNVKIINIPKNEGFGKACNIGAKEARGRTLLFLNPDTEIVSGNVEMVLREQKDKNIAIIGSNLINSSGKTHKWSAGKKINIYDLARNNLRLPRSRTIWDSPNKIRADWVSGTALFIKKEVFSRLGGFDEKFFMYFEDIDLCRRAKKHGHRVLYFPHFQVFHHGGQSYDNKITQKEHYYASQEYYFKKHCGAIQTMFLKILKVFSGKR